MNRAPLVHVYPQWEAPEDEPAAAPEDYREVWTGRMRIVHNRRRMRVLRRRGVRLMDCRAFTAAGYVGPKCWAWFTEEAT